MLIDTHCHVHFNAFKDDMDDVVRSALEQDVAMITVGTQKDTSANGVKLAERYDKVWASVGLHPSHLMPGYVDEQEVQFRSRNEKFDEEYYRELLRHPKVVAVGEMGLDYYHENKDISIEEMKKLQSKAFEAGARLAISEKLPIIVHCRDAHDDQTELLTKIYGPFVDGDSPRGVIHCFTGTVQDAERYMHLGFFISFTGIITFPPRKAEPVSEHGAGSAAEKETLQDVVRWAPLDKILVETDAPYLAPVPMRGKRNLPEYVKHVAEKVAELKGLDFKEVEEQTTKNALNLFRKMQF